ncbi:sulfite exporter TauE/SafE family protein [Halomicrobium katesii]|uniref:sulfite exporter TauE/SafE family protein n=1 Tax=Halomicrobium katesii TaxID=437163 RepID=UPI00035D5B20|nr:sulfite exporter TauE/SafE family protein [Halomicrobium katesii]
MSVPQVSGALSGQVELVVFALVGLLGGVHCLGMCGPLVTVYADQMGTDGPATWRTIRQHLLFNLGRTAIYTALGVLFGGLGALLYDAAAVAAVANDVRAVAGLVIGGVILLVGANYLLTGTGGLFGHAPTPAVFERVSTALLDRIERWVRGPRIVALGAAHGVLPCPLLYPAFLYAFATGSPVRGGVALAVLGLATVPTVFAYGVAFQSISPRFQGPLHRLLGVTFLLLGYLPLAHGAMLLGIHLPHPSIPIYQPLG